MANKLENDKKFRAIVDSVSYWLGYQFKIGRHKLVHEASLRYPIADTITARDVSIDRIVLEKSHPLFVRKRIDLAIYDNNINIQDGFDDNGLEEAYEFKIAKRETGRPQSNEHQRVFDDIVRLAYYHKQKKEKDCYFLMCGIYEDFKTYFIGQKNEVKYENGKNTVASRKSNLQNNSLDIESEEWKPDGLYKDWFGFKIGESKEKEFQDSDNGDKWGLYTFKENYKTRTDIPELGDSIKIKTTCRAITPPGLENIRTHAAGIWKIEGIS